MPEHEPQPPDGDISTNPVRPRYAGVAVWAALFLSLALYLAAVRPYFGVTADDAYISFRYALSWASGCGPVFNCGEAPVEGYTNFLWVALASLVIGMGFEVAPVMRVFGLAFGFLALAVAVPLVRRLNGRLNAGVLVPLIGVGSSPFWAVNAVSGLETGAATLSVLCAATFALDLPGGRKPWRSGLAWAVSYLIRPEAAVLAAVTGAWALGCWLKDRLGLRRIVRLALLYGGGFLIVALPFFVWRVVYYGALYPNTYYAKRAKPLLEIIPANLRYLSENWPFFVVLLCAALAAVLVRRRASYILLLLLALASAGISLSVHNNFWMPGHRLYLTAVMLLAVLCSGLAHVSRPRGEPDARWSSRLGQVMPRAVVGVVAALLLWWSWQAFDKIYYLAHLHYAKDHAPARRMGERIRRMAKPGDWLAIRDAGMVPFFAGTKVKVLDMHNHSLNDARIAKKGWDVRYVLSFDPRFVVLASHRGYPLLIRHKEEWILYHFPGFQKRYHHILTEAWHRARHFFLYLRR